MSFDNFLAHFKVASSVRTEPFNAETISLADNDFISCIDVLGGKSFNNGIYRVFPGSQVAIATASIEQVFPEYQGRIAVFGYDWLGRHFATDAGRRAANGKPFIVLLEPGTGIVLQIPVTIMPFHNDELVNHGDDALATPFYREWIKLHPDEIQIDQCVGYKVPLFLGGKDTIENLELIDMSVYIELCGQLRNKIRNLPAGTSIRDISIGP